MKQKRNSPDQPGAPSPENKIVIALQGSFGHIDYAAGILDAFREHNNAADGNEQRAIHFAAGSACVEMMTPLWLYLANQNGAKSIRDLVLNENKRLPLYAQQSLAPPSVRPDAWGNYFAGLVEAQFAVVNANLNLFTDSSTTPSPIQAPHHGRPGEAPVPTKNNGSIALTTALQKMWMCASGLPGTIAFNPFFVADKEASLALQYADTTVPTLFTNATDATNFDEIYLYCGKDPEDDELTAMRGDPAKRVVKRLTPEYFFASGARPPYIAPIPVAVDNKTRLWMEGAMRCNPPLTPLVGIGATHIVLLRFFSKTDRTAPHNYSELNERFLDAMFNIPLQKEIESIRLNNYFADCEPKAGTTAEVPPKLFNRRKVTILDPADPSDLAHSGAFIDFLKTDLNALSHYEVAIPALREQMSARGLEIGKLLVADLKAHLR